MKKPTDNARIFLSRLAPYVYSDGARNLNRISRELSIPYQTLRERMIRLKSQGISILPLITPENMGLERIRVSFLLSKDVKNNRIFFGSLYRAAGLHYYARSLFSQAFDCEFFVPRGKMKELDLILKKLEEMKIVKNPIARKIDWKEILMMKTEYYDYENGQWDVDFSRLIGDPSIELPSSSAASVIEEHNFLSASLFDHADLIIAKSLQIDPWVKLVDIARILRLTDNDVSYHMKKHVFGRKQIAGFRLKWIGDKTAWAKHTITPITLLFDNLSSEELRHAISIVTSVPFTWNHMRATDGAYLSELLVPAIHAPETIRYLSDKLRDMDLVPQVLLADWSCMSNYTIPYEMHNEKLDRWEFVAEESLERVLQTIKPYNE
jgi:hypothetical protein